MEDLLVDELKVEKIEKEFLNKVEKRLHSKEVRVRTNDNQSDTEKNWNHIKATLGNATKESRCQIKCN